MYALRDERYRYLKYFLGSGIDLGCGQRGERIITKSIGIDNGGGAVTVSMDTSSLDLFSDERMDYIFVGNVLDTIPDYKEALKDYWRVLKPGGYLIISNPNLSPQGAGIFHSLSSEEVIKNLPGEFVVLENETFLVKQKFNLVIGKGKDFVVPKTRPEKEKVIWIIRYGAIGDQVISSSILPSLKEKYPDSYIIWNCQEYGSDILLNNPYIDELYIQPKDAFPFHLYKDYWLWLEENISSLVINLSASVEEALLKVWWTPEYYLSKERLHEVCDINYYQNQFLRANLEIPESPRGQIFFTQKEEYWFNKEIKSQIKTPKYICWALSGSSLHKSYPYAEQVMKDLLILVPGLSIITLGGETDRLLEPNHPRILKGCSVLSIRQSAMAIKYSNGLVTPETGFMHMAGALDIPCVTLLSHSSRKNETSTFKYDWAIEPKVPCYPCHKLHHLRGFCPESIIGPDFSFPDCMAKGILPNTLMDTIIKMLEDGEGKNSG